MLWLGYGFWFKVVMVLIIIYFFVIFLFFDVLMWIYLDWLGLVWVMKVMFVWVMWYICILVVLSGFVLGLRLVVVYVLIGVIIGEWVGVSKGFGYLMFLVNGWVKIDLMFVVLIVLVVLILCLYVVVDLFCCKVLDCFM